MPNSRRGVSSRKHILVALLAFSSLTSGERAFAAGALPSGGSFAAGAGSIAAAANGVNVTQSTSRGVINWQSFSIGQGNTVNIANGSGATLNRVTGGDISSIAGSLTSTGSVYVINQAGVLVTPTGKVNTVGTFVASTRDVADSSFMAGGAQNFVGNSAGTVVNQGSITSANGDVVLVGKFVSNSGQIAAANGDVILAAGDNVVLQPAGGDSQILISAGSGDVTNTGTINAAQAELNAAGGNVYALASNNGGIVRASGTTLKDGHVYLTAGDDVTVDGAVTATNADGSGGTINVTGGASAGALNVTGSLSASATGGAAKGGKIVATAATVNIGATANIAANGAAGGTVLLGGDRHGGSDSSLDFSSTPVANAQTTTVAAGAQISADGGKLGGSGNGGNVVVWSDQQTSFAGAISAQGGATGGNGGFVEVSGEQQLAFTGTVTTAAPFGTTGTLLLDPADVTISSSATSNDASDGQSPTSTFSPTSGSATSNILNTTIQTALGSNDVTITTTNSGTSGAGTGNITVNAPITWSSSHALTLTAAGTIIFGADADSIAATGAGSVTLNAAGNGSLFPFSNFGVLIGAPISTTTGSITIHATNTGAGQGQIFFNGSSDTLTTTSGNITLTTNSNIVTNANIGSTSGGNINLVSTGTGTQITIGNADTVSTTGTGSVLVQADQVFLGSGQESLYSGQIITDPTLGKVTIQPASGGTVYIGDAATPTILINDMSIGLITTGTLVIGSDGATPVNGFTGGNVTGLIIGDNLSSFGLTTFNNTFHVSKIPLASVNNLELFTGATGYVSENDSSQGNYGITVGANGTGGLAVVAGTYIDLSGVGSVLQAGFSGINQAGTIALKLTGTPAAVPGADASPSVASVQFGGDAGSGSLTVGTVNGVSGINAPGAAVYLANAGTVVQTAPIIAASLDLEGAGAAGSSTPTTNVTGTYALTNASNAIGSVSGNVSSLTLYDSTALTQTGTTALTGYGTGTGLTNASVQIADPISITLDSGSTITNAAGGDIQLETSGTFTSGASTTLSTTGADTTAAGGHWRVYSQNPALDSRGVLDFGYIQYNTPNSATAGTSFSSSFPSVLGTGNGLIYAIQPTASLAVTATRQYDTTNTALNAILNFGAVSGAETGDTVLLNSPTGNGTFNHPNVAGVNAATTVSVGGVTLNTGGTLGGEYANNGTKNVPVYNYAINSTASGAGTITPVDVTAVGSKDLRRQRERAVQHVQLAHRGVFRPTAQTSP